MPETGENTSISRPWTLVQLLGVHVTHSFGEIQLLKDETPYEWLINNNYILQKLMCKAQFSWFKEIQLRLYHLVGNALATKCA